MESVAGERATYWPRRTWVAVLLLAGNLLFPALVWGACALTETPTGEAIDWRAESPTARAVDALLYAHLAYAPVLVVLMRGRRVRAGCAGLAGLVVTAVTNFLAYFRVTGVYW